MAIVKLPQRVSDIIMRMLEATPFKQLYDINGYIAGGFARQCAIGNMETKDNIANYLNGYGVECSNPRFERRAPGDIDVFFPRAAGQSGPEDGAIKQILRCQTPFMEPRVSITGLCLNVGVGEAACDAIGRHSFIYSQIQCVINNSLRGTPTEVMNGFDFVNCRAAIMRDGSILADERLLDIESNKQLLVGRMNSPMLMKRILKYIEYRDLKTVHEDSRPAIIEWLTRHVTESGFDSPEKLEKLLSGHNTRMSTHTLRRLVHYDALNAHDLVMLIGKHIENRYTKGSRFNNYQSVNLGIVDVALEEIAGMKSNS